MEATQNSKKIEDKKERLPLALRIALRNSPMEQLSTLQEAFQLQQNKLDRHPGATRKLSTLLTSSSSSEDDSQKKDLIVPMIEHVEADCNQGETEIPCKLEAEGRVKNLKDFWLRTIDKTDNFPLKKRPEKSVASTSIKRSNSELGSGFPSSKTNYTNSKLASVENKRALTKSWSLTTANRLPSITSFSKTQSTLDSGSSSEKETSLYSGSSSSILSLASNTDDVSEQGLSSSSEVSCIPEEMKSVKSDSSLEDEANFSVDCDSIQESNTSIKEAMVEYKYIIDHDKDSSGKPIVWFRTDSGPADEKKTFEDIGYTSYESCNSSNSSLAGQKQQKAKELGTILDKSVSYILTPSHKEKSGVEEDVSSRSVREKIACFNSKVISENMGQSASASDAFSASTDEENTSQRKDSTSRESDTPPSVFTDSDSDESCSSSDDNAVVIKYKYYLSSNKDCKGRPITWTTGIDEQPHINVEKYKTKFDDVSKNERTSETEEKTNKLRPLSNDRDKQEVRVKNLAFLPSQCNLHRSGKGSCKDIEETLTVYKTPKVKNYRKKKLHDVSESKGKAVFKATIQGMRYNAVLKLSDDISYLRTFIQVISGIPPKKQNLFPRTRKNHLVRTVRDLGVNAGDILHLEVK